MEEYLATFAVYDDERSIETVVEMMKNDRITHLDIHTDSNGKCKMVYKSRVMGTNTTIRMKVMRYSFLVLFFAPDNAMYPDIIIAHN